MRTGQVGGKLAVCSGKWQRLSPMLNILCHLRLAIITFSAKEYALTKIWSQHRDLHWGQVLVKNVPTNALKTLNLNQKTMSKSDRIYMDDLAHGVQATVIDLGLSRMDAGDGSDGDQVHWTPFDDEVFMGEGAPFRCF